MRPEVASLAHRKSFPLPICVHPRIPEICAPRRELKFPTGHHHGGGHRASGLMGPGMYTATETKHLIDRLHTRGALRLFDVDGTFEEEIIPGVAVRLSGGHTPGSISILVETDEGLANIAGDIAYHLGDQLINPILDQAAHEPTIPGNHAMSTLQEKMAIKRALSGTRFLLISHDAPALISGGKVVGRFDGAIDNPKADVTTAASYDLLARPQLADEIEAA